MLPGVALTLTLLWVTLGVGSVKYVGRRHRHQRHTYVTPDMTYDRVLMACPEDCVVRIPNVKHARATFQDFLDEPDTQLIHFKVTLLGYNRSVLEAYPYMGNSFRASEWVWASGAFGRKLLELPLDADILSLYVLGSNRKELALPLETDPPRCLMMQTPECRLHAVRGALIANVTYVERHRHRRDFVCHRVINESRQSAHAQLVYRCCDTTEYRNGDISCTMYTSYGNEISGVLALINVIAAIVTIWSPVFIMRAKLFLKYDFVTKFFRASLKHGITGQRNYVIRISSRQLINLNDAKPFSIPRFLFRIIFHCYGEGRCCIHWWCEWRHQPALCRRRSWCRRCWLAFWRYLAVAAFYPLVVYVAVALYAPQLTFFMDLLSHVGEHLDTLGGTVSLNVNLVAVALLPAHHPYTALWMLFAFVAFVYVVLLLSWPNNPLERCLLRYEGKRPLEQPGLLYDRMTRGYKAVLHKLAYGEFTAKRHFFRIPWIPWGLRRVFRFLGRALSLLPVFNVCFSLLVFDSQLFRLSRPRGGGGGGGLSAKRESAATSDTASDYDESEDELEVGRPTCGCVCKWILTLVIWLGFVFILSGYCTAVFVMAEFLLNIVFFTLLGAALHSNTVLPWVCFSLVLAFYVNDTLTLINREHCEILKLIDENSPRISAVEDGEEVFRGDGAIQILKTHNLGAVKFIDGDNTEYVSKELYYNVCTDLKCGWGRSLRRILLRMSILLLFLLFVFLSLTSLGPLLGSGLTVSVLALLASALPKLLQLYLAAQRQKPDVRTLWAKIMPDILDRHIRVDRTQSLDPHEEELTTYDVRPVGLLELDIPRVQRLRALRLWKFPWVVSADQQTQSHESFIVALANKLGAASFLSKVVTRAYSSQLVEETVLRQWCLLVENCILEGSATASSINGVPVESVRLFPRDVQPLVSPFDTGNTIDNVVDNINRELYGRFTRGVLVTIGNTSIAICNLDNTIFAFNSSCHGDQVTDLFGAVLVAADFNIQNIQSVIKYLVDPYSPDTVPVYGTVPIEGFVFKSPEILEAELDM